MRIGVVGRRLYTGENGKTLDRFRVSSVFEGRLTYVALTILHRGLARLFHGVRNPSRRLIIAKFQPAQEGCVAVADIFTMRRRRSDVRLAFRGCTVRRT